jgi:hypothetical protein
MTNMQRFRLILLAFIAAFIGLMVGLEWQKSKQGDVCDASHQWCQEDISGTSTRMQVISDTEGDRIITPTPIRIRFDGLDQADNIRVRLSGHNMYMGQFDINLERQGELWQASTPLPNCIPDHEMIWRIDFLPPYEGVYYFTSTEYESPNPAK